MKKVIFINSHPIQYFTPLYTLMNEKGIATEAWYCSDESYKGGIDKQFGVSVKWDIPLLQGYKYEFFSNYSWKPSHANGFFGLINLGMIVKLCSIPKSVIVVHGWHYLTHLLIILIGNMLGHNICLRYEMPQNQDVLRKGFKQALKKIFLKQFVFPNITHFLYIGTQNYLLYKQYKISESRLLFCPYSVDNQRFKTENEKLINFSAEIKRKIGIPATAKIILYSGKYIEKKRPIDILEAFRKINNPEYWLIMVGEGELRKEMEELISEYNLKNVMLTGFINQSSISEYYAISNVFVMCSAVGETWGLSVNEALNFGLPLVVSHLTGCAVDLVKDGVNGFIFETGNIDELSTKLEQVLDCEKQFRENNYSEIILNKYSYNTVIENIRTITVKRV